MRTPDEIRFRLRQELANVWLWAFPPGGEAHAPAPRSPFPDGVEAANAAKETPWAATVIATADRILSGYLPLLGGEVETGPKVAWRRDYQRNLETPPAYFRRIPYLDVTRAGDHKLIWEMSRHQHLVLVAQAFLLTGDVRYRDYVFGQLRHWWEENPFQRGINWASALEVAFRALSWIWLHHLLGSAMPGSFRDRFLTELARHGYHLEYNLSLYFSPNTHLLGEAVALHALGALFPQFRHAGKWRTLGRAVVLRELEHQVQQDGSHFEQSTYYHVYAVDFFVLHHCIEPMPEAALQRLRAMAEFLAAVVGHSGILPFFGDDDGGRLFHPFGPRNGFARATLATCSLVLGEPYFAYTHEDLLDQAVWWIGPQVLHAEAKPAPSQRDASVLFPNSGLAVMSDGGDTHVVVDAGPFGWANAGHSHSDALSLVVRHGAEEILIDPGTYTYVGDLEERNAFRGSSAHNTLRIDGRDQADPAGPFRWLNKPAVEVIAWDSGQDLDFLHAACAYRGMRHRRQVWFRKRERLLVVLDTVEGEGEHQIEQFWHAGCSVSAGDEERWRIGDSNELALAGGDGASLWEGWRSDAPGLKRAAPVIRVVARAALPLRLAAVLRIGGAAPETVLEGGGVRVDGVRYGK